MSQPNLSPHEKRDRIVASYLKTNETYGIEQTPADVETMVVSDMRLVDAADARGEIGDGGPSDAAPQDSEPPKERPDPIRQAELETGVFLRAPTSTTWRPRLRNAKVLDDRWGYTRGRIKRILSEGVIASAKGPTFIGKLGPLAKEVCTLEALWQLRNQPPAGRGFVRNVFDGLSDRDALAAFRRLLEDVCDRSTGVLGQWYRDRGVHGRAAGGR